MFVIKEILTTFIILIVVYVIRYIVKGFKIDNYNAKKFKEQLNWYHSYYGDEHTSYLMKELTSCTNPYKLLNEIMKNLNPELVNENIPD